MEGQADVLITAPELIYLISDSMDSIYGNSINPNEKTKKKNPIDFKRKNGSGDIPRGIGFGSPDACECFRYAPDAGSADILKNCKSRKFLFLRENGFRKKDGFIVSKRQTAKTDMTASHVFIKNSFCDGIYHSILCLSRKHEFSFFCTANSFHHEIMFWLEGAEVEGSYFKQKNYHPSSPWCCLINSVNSAFVDSVISYRFEQSGQFLNGELSWKQDLGWQLGGPKF